MGAISIRVFSSHPVAAADYARLLAHEKDFRLVADGELSQIGVFDSELASLDAVLTLTRLRAPTMRPLLLASPCDENECLRWLFRGVWGVVAYERYEENLPRAVRQVAEGQLWFPAPVVIRWMTDPVSLPAFSLGLLVCLQLVDHLCGFGFEQPGNSWEHFPDLVHRLPFGFQHAVDI